MIVGLGVGAVASGGNSDQSDEAAAADDNGSTATPADDETTTTERVTTTQPPTTTERATTTTLPPYDPQPEDFEIGIVEMERSCFGSAGCNISYRIEVSYLGEQPMPPSASYTVVYEVHGGDDLQTKNFDVQGSDIEFSEERISTPPDPSLSAVAVRVLNN